MHEKSVLYFQNSRLCFFGFQHKNFVFSFIFRCLTLRICLLSHHRKYFILYGQNFWENVLYVHIANNNVWNVLFCSAWLVVCTRPFCHRRDKQLFATAAGGTSIDKQHIHTTRNAVWTSTATLNSLRNFRRRRCRRTVSPFVVLILSVTIQFLWKLLEVYFIVYLTTFLS
jgi:hypothetical protein